MSVAHPGREPGGGGAAAGFSPWKLLLPAAAALVLVSLVVDWYAESVSLPRYCQQQALTLQRLESVLSQARPAGDERRVPFVIVAKLLYLVPQQAAESTAEYLARLQGHIQQRCG